jgi:uncharacterized membrane protein
MRQIEVQVRSERVDEVVRVGDEHGGFAPSHHPIRVEGEGGWSGVTVNVPNHRVGSFVAAVEAAVGKAEFVIPTSGTLPIRTPVSEVRDRVADVSRRSTLELVLDVHQSLGTWTGMLLYALVSGIVAAWGVMFDVPFLLTAAMLIAPLGAPAMVCVVAVAIGDGWMLRRGGLRFAVALVVLAASAALLGWAYGLRDSTVMMESLTNLSSWSALLGVAGGAAGAMALIQTERDSLVTATATGFLVAVSLSPPSAVLGLAVALRRWDYVGLMAFLLALTFAGVLAGGWLALRLRGVGPGEPAVAARGGKGTRTALAASVVVVLAGLVLWQARQGPRFRKADMARSAATLAGEAVQDVPGYRLLLADAEFTPGDADWHEGEGLVVRLVVARTGGAPAAGERGSIRGAVRRAITARMEGVRPFVAVTIVEDEVR